MFASALGKPLSLNSDYREWKALLQAAGAPDGRLHDARHTAATVLLVLGVPEGTVMSVMGVVEHGDGRALSARDGSAPA